jgi:hypothetical protein
VRYCPDHDPILLAASIICGTCKAESFPADAEWMPDGMILADYVTTHQSWCTRRPQFGMILLDPASDNQAVPAPARPRSAIWCTATTMSGTLCSFRVKADGLCGVHLARRDRQQGKGAAR